MKNRPHVALVIATSDMYGRQLLRGIARYIRTHDSWSIFLNERELWAPVPDWLWEWEDGDGVICRATTPEYAAIARSRSLPVVDLGDRYGYQGIPRISSDMHAIGRMAAQHLMERGFKHIAFCGFSDQDWSGKRLRGVEEAAADKLCGVYDSPWEGLRQRSWEDERGSLCEWLQTLPRPVGIVTCNDARGQHLLDACRESNIAVPEEIAIVGVDNAETFCELCNPPLSSVVPNAELVGYEAAALLERLMNGEKAPEENRLVPPLKVITRQSSDTLSIEDHDIAIAVRYIRENACKGISVNDVLAKTSFSRSALERGFRHFLGHSPHDEIQRVRLNRVKQLIVETDWSLERIAGIAGFEHPEYMMVQFKKVTGKTPTQWRQAAQTAPLEIL